MAVVNLRRVAPLLLSGPFPDPGLSSAFEELANQIQEGITEFGSMGLVTGRTPQTGVQTVWAYEVDGYSGQYLMDDANIPSLLSLPYLGFVSRNDSDAWAQYVRTRQAVLSDRFNPYFFQGSAGAGVGGPHNGWPFIWPMALIQQAMSAESDDEIIKVRCVLYWLN
jgi:meiotically up-regulated gene 157 (Mug157) protein